MRKNLLLIVTILITNIVYGQTIVRDTPLSYTQVFEASGFTANELYQNIKSWYLSNPINYDFLNIYEEPSEHKMIVRGMFPAKELRLFKKKAHYSAYILFTMNIEVREGRYKVTVDHMRHIDPDAGSLIEIDEDGSPTYNGDVGFGLLTESAEPPHIQPFGVWTFKKSKLKQHWDEVRDESLQEVDAIARSIGQYLDRTVAENEW